MKRISLILMVFTLLLAGCKSTVRDKRETESPVPSATPRVTEETKDVSAEDTPSTEIPTADSGRADTVVVLVPRAVEALDPFLMRTVNPEDSIAAHLWDTLIWLDDDLNLQPRLAESWRLVNDTTWEIKLRSDVVFHNDEPFNAAAAKYSIERTAQLEGGLETFAADVGLQQIEVIDDYTIRLITAESDASVPYQLASVEMLPPGYYGFGGTASTSSPVGSGPYRFSRRDGDGSIILEANPDYWQGTPTIYTLIFRPIPDPATRVKQLLDGKAHLISGLSPDQVANLETDNTRVELIESTRRLFIGIRVDTAGPLADRQVRQALNYAIDVNALVDNFSEGYGQRYGSWVNPPHNANALSPWPYDPSKARALLARAGYADGFQITLDTPIGRYHEDQAVAYAVAEQLAQVGIQVQVQSYEWPSYVYNRLIPKETSSLFLLSLASWGNGLEDVANLSTNFPFNPTLWHNAEFERLVAEARASFNDTRRQALLNQAQTIAYEEAPWIWLWRPYDFYGVAAWLDWQPRADGLLYLYRTETP
jgi:peptide/nickel transport system substrate-binding protein